MVLSNAERQARFQKRLREKATQGVTVEMIDQVAALTWERHRKDDPDLSPWDEVLASCGTKAGLRAWEFHLQGLATWIPAESDADLAEAFGGDANLVRRVGAVLQAVLVPPSKRT